MIEELDFAHATHDEYTPRPSMDPRAGSNIAGRVLVPPGEALPLIAMPMLGHHRDPRWFPGMLLAGRGSFEVSIHQPSREMLSQIPAVFPEAPKHEGGEQDSRPLVVPSFQVAPSHFVSTQKGAPWLNESAPSGGSERHRPWS